MGRLVRKPQPPQVNAETAEHDDHHRSNAVASQVANIEHADGYLERMAKYVPAEIIAFSMLVNAILEQAMKAGGANATMAGVPVPIIAAGALIVGCILTPLFCWYVRQEGDAWVLNAVVSTVALPFWAYLMGAVVFANYHDGNLAVILVLTFTAVSGLVAPWPKQRERCAQEQERAAHAVLSETPRLFNALAS
jgi:hypothetical protein